MRHLYLDSHFQPDMYKSNSCPSSPNQLFPQFSKWKNPFLRLLRLKSLRLYKTSVFLLYFISNLSANPVTFSSKISPNSDPLSSPPPCFELSFYLSYYNSCQTVFLFLTPLLISMNSHSAPPLLKTIQRTLISLRVTAEVLTTVCKSPCDVIPGYFPELISSVLVTITPALLSSLLFLKNAPNGLSQDFVLGFPSAWNNIPPQSIWLAISFLSGLWSNITISVTLLWPAYIIDSYTPTHVFLSPLDFYLRHSSLSDSFYTNMYIIPLQCVSFQGFCLPRIVLQTKMLKIICWKNLESDIR